MTGDLRRSELRTSDGPTAPATARLEVLHASESEVAVVVLAGELDAATSSVLRAALQAISCGVRQIDIDMAGVSLIDSCGVGALVAAQHALRNDFCQVSIRNPSPLVRRVLELSDATAHLDVIDRPPIQQPMAI
jgi:anti-sigma B factor antagonist